MTDLIQEAPPEEETGERRLSTFEACQQLGVVLSNVDRDVLLIMEHIADGVETEALAEVRLHLMHAQTKLLVARRTIAHRLAEQPLNRDVE